MRLGLTYKLLAALIFTAVVIVILLVGTMQFVARRNFTDYLARVELGQTDKLVQSLAKEYGKAGSWNGLRNDPRVWPELLADHLAKDLGFGGAMPPPRPRPPVDEDLGAPGWGEPPPYPDYMILDREHPHRGPPLPLPPYSPGTGDIIHRLTLFDTHKRPVVGPPGSQEKRVFRKVVVNGKTVGWLGLLKAKNLASPLNIDFLRRQTNALYMTGMAIFLIAAVISIFLSRRMLAPVRKLTDGTRALRKFRFDTKVDVDTKDELGQLADDFNLMAETLKKYEDMRRQWITDISHELRTPLAILQGEIEAIQDGIRSPNVQTIGSLHTEVKRISKLVENLHLLSLGDSYKLLMRKDWVEPLVLLAKSLELFETRLNQRDLRIQWGPENKEQFAMLGDGDRLMQLFSNLLENVVRYADSRGVVRITHTVSDTGLSICIEDSGPGVPPDSLDRLFDRLYRVDKSRSRALGGSGLGLSICKEIVESHGGSIVTEKSDLGGLAIKIFFPAERTQSEES